MGRRSAQDDPNAIASQLPSMLGQLDAVLAGQDLRAQVQALVPILFAVRDLGSSLIPPAENSAKKRLLYYLKRYQRTPIPSDELRVAAGIDDWARRVRELRVENGWQIISGATLAEMDSEDAEAMLLELGITELGDEEYVLLRDQADEEAAARWRSANEIRRMDISIRDKILLLLRRNVGEPITGEQIRYVAGDQQTEWARRTRELRTEFGWPVATKTSGRPDLPVGVYVLEDDRQAPVHDRAIPDPTRRAVLQRDGYACTKCGWQHSNWNPSDPRHLEAHHVKPHVRGGGNDAENLMTLCSVCHDEVHADTREHRNLFAAEEPAQ